MLAVGLLLQASAPPIWPPPGDRDRAAEIDRAPQQAEHEKPWQPSLLVRMTLATGFARPSDHARLLEEDGFQLGNRTYAELALSGVLLGHLSLGAYVGYGIRDSTPSSTAPTLSESVLRAGGEVAYVVQPNPALLLLVGPELGFLDGKLEVHGNASSQGAFEYGAVAGAYFRLGRASPSWFFGVTAAYSLAPVDPPGGVGRRYDFGAFYLGFSGVIGA